MAPFPQLTTPSYKQPRPSMMSWASTCLHDYALGSLYATMHETYNPDTDVLPPARPNMAYTLQFGSVPSGGVPGCLRPDWASVKEYTWLVTTVYGSSHTTTTSRRTGWHPFSSSSAMSSSASPLLLQLSTFVDIELPILQFRFSLPRWMLRLGRPR